MARRLLFGYLSGTHNVDLSSGGRAIQLHEGHIVDLVALAFGPDGDARELVEQRGVAAVRRAAILREIETFIADPSLSATAIASRFSITPRYLRLLLEETGGASRSTFWKNASNMPPRCCAILGSRIEKSPQSHLPAGSATFLISIASFAVAMARRPRTCARPPTGRSAIKRRLHCPIKERADGRTPRHRRCRVRSAKARRLRARSCGDRPSCDSPSSASINDWDLESIVYRRAYQILAERRRRRLHAKSRAAGRRERLHSVGRNTSEIDVEILGSH